VSPVDESVIEQAALARTHQEALPVKIDTLAPQIEAVIPKKNDNGGLVDNGKFNL